MMFEHARAAAEHWASLLASDYGASTIEALTDAIDRYHFDVLLVALRPCFLQATTLESAREATVAVTGAIQTATDRVLSDRAFRLRVGFPAYMDELVELDGPASRGSMFSRFDGLFDAAGTLRFIEYNNIPLGITEGFEASKALERAPIARAFARRFPFAVDDTRERLVDALVDEIRERGRPRPVGLNFSTDAPTITLATERWLGYLASRGIRLTFFPLHELDVGEDAVYAGDARVDIVNLSVDELLRSPDPLRPLLAAVRRGIVRTLYGLSSSVISGSKILFEVLSDPEHANMFDVATQRALQMHVPWTRHVRPRKTTLDGKEIDLLAVLSAHRERFVLKPAGSFGGSGVVVGASCDQQTWDRALAATTRRPHVAQDRIATAGERYPMLVDGGIVERTCTADYGPFVWRGTTAAGQCVRIGEGMHNVAGGASIAPVFILPRT